MLNPCLTSAPIDRIAVLIVITTAETAQIVAGENSFRPRRRPEGLRFPVFRQSSCFEDSLALSSEGCFVLF